jgi:hypothetical protein
VTRCKTKKRHDSEESGPSKRKKMAQETPQTNDGETQQPNESENTHDSDSDDEGKIWREGNVASEEKSRDEEFQEYLEALLL